MAKNRAYKALPEGETLPDVDLAKLDEAQKLGLPAELHLPAVPPSPGLSHPVTQYLASLAESAQDTQSFALDGAARLFLDDPKAKWNQVPWSKLSYEHVNGFRSILRKKVEGGVYAISTANRWIAAVKRVLEEAWRLKQYSFEDMTILQGIKVIPGSIEPPGRVVLREEYRKIMALYDLGAGALSLRNAALISAMYTGGFRRDEISTLTLGTFDHGAKENYIHVVGKGNKQRKVPILFKDGWARVTAWRTWLGVQEPEKYLRRDPMTTEQSAWTTPLIVDTAPLEPGTPFLRPVRKGGKVVTAPLQGRDVARVVDQAITVCGLDPFTPHDLRRTFASNCLSAGVDIALIQDMMGHASVTTTARYDRRGEGAVRGAAEKLAAFMEEES